MATWKDARTRLEIWARQRSTERVPKALHGHVAFVAGEDRLLLAIGRDGLSVVDEGPVDVAILGTAVHLVRLVADPTRMVSMLQRGEITLSDDSWAPILHRLLEPQYQTDARTMRVLGRRAGWLRLA